ncbi:MAG TPA: hypothetical protein VLB29_05605 [Nocardioidaceae bacterium]|nr:hypothetical protein [Nocardioidaceae bacterium]
MTVATERRRPPVAARRVGFVIAALINAALLYAVNVWPGWEELPFLTGQTTEVLGLVNASLIASVVANIVYIAYDAGRLRALGDIVTTSIGLAAMIQIWQVYPFDFEGYSVDWDVVVRILLVIGMVGSVIGIFVRFVNLVRGTPSRS